MKKIVGTILVMSMLVAGGTMTAMALENPTYDKDTYCQNTSESHRHNEDCNWGDNENSTWGNKGMYRDDNTYTGNRNHNGNGNGRNRNSGGNCCNR